MIITKKNNKNFGKTSVTIEKKKLLLKEKIPHQEVTPSRDYEALMFEFF
jgi:hypothetical protein